MDQSKKFFFCVSHILYISQSQLSFNFFSGFPARLIVISIYYNIIKFLTNSAFIFFYLIQFEKATKYKLQDYMLFLLHILYIDM